MADNSVEASSRPIFGRIHLGWKSRHLLVLILAVLGTYAFLESRAQWSDMHRWNRALGDISVVLVALSMAIGPLARLWPACRAAVPWRRELGIYGVLLAFAHTVIILVGWVEWDFMRLFGYAMHPQAGIYVMVQHGFGLSNAIGILALVYGLVLAVASNDWSQRVLSGSVWKFLQQSAYVLWMLIVIHTAYFLYLHFQDFHRSVPEPNWVQIPFAVLVVAITLLQLAASVKTWKSRRKTPRKPTSWATNTETASSAEGSA
jgi:methionine sulfoxide reductase heme-binding subunit